MSIDVDSDIKVASIAKVRESVTKDSNIYNEEYIEEEPMSRQKKKRKTRRKMRKSPK